MSNFFNSADGSVRCKACGLFPDICTCDPAHRMNEVLRQVGWGRLRNPTPSMLRDEMERFEAQNIR